MTLSLSKQLDQLIEKLMNEEVDVRYHAAQRIATKVKLPIEQVLMWTDDTRPRMREMASFILGAMSRTEESQAPPDLFPEAVPALIRLLSDPNEEVRSGAANALGHHAVPSTLPALLHLATDPFAEVRSAVAQALAGFSASIWHEKGNRYKADVTAVLLRLMDDTDEEVRQWATLGIHEGDHNTLETRQRLWKALDDPDPEMRGEAAEGLARFSDHSLLPRLEKLLREDDDLVPSYFLAARRLGDTRLLPAVLEAAQRLHKDNPTNDWAADLAIASLQEK